MTYAQALDKATKNLESAGIGTARLDALILLEHVTDTDRAIVLANSDHILSSLEKRKFNNLLNSRVNHTPIAYLLGYSDFYGRKFVIKPSVLEPRPESEAMIEQLLKLPNLPQKPYIADVGCGSGALGITAKLELPNAYVELLDIDDKALKIAKTNVDLFTPGVPTIKSDLLSRATQNNDVLLCNLPYVPDDYQINRAASHEPRIAIFGGGDGLDVYRKLFTQTRSVKYHPLFILTEALPPQHETLSAIANKSGYSLSIADDFVQVFQKQK